MLAWKCQEWVLTGDSHPRNHNPFQFGTTYQFRNSSGERIQIDQSAFAAATAKAKGETQDLNQSPLADWPSSNSDRRARACGDCSGKSNKTRTPVFRCAHASYRNPIDQRRIIVSSARLESLRRVQHSPDRVIFPQHRKNFRIAQRVASAPHDAEQFRVRAEPFQGDVKFASNGRLEVASRPLAR
jgi:hypothetical protein